MTSRFVLLLTQDPALQISLKRALARDDSAIFVAHDSGEALQAVCTHANELDFAVIDFADGCHGMTLLSAVQICHPALPIVVVTSTDPYHVAAIAYANGVEACLAKPVSAEELQIVIHELAETKLQLEAA
jgi:DNA-binding NtrC family response regulator